MKGTAKEIRPGVWKIRIFLRHEVNQETGKKRPLYVSETFYGSERDKDTRQAELVAKYAHSNRASGSETLGELLDSWADHCAADWSPTTLRTNKQVIKSTIKPELGDVKLNKLRATDLERLYQARQKLGNSDRTIIRTHSLIRAALEHGRLEGLVTGNVADDVRNLPKVGRTPVKAPSTQEVLNFTLACDREGKSWLGAFLRLTGYVGMRRGELCGLRWSDVDLDGCTLTVRRSIYGTPGGGWAEKTPKTEAGTRTIPLTDDAVAILKWHREDMVDQWKASPVPDGPHRFTGKALRLLTVPRDGFVFTPTADWSEPYFPDSVSRGVKRVADVCGIHMTAHMLRHYLATTLISGNVAPNTVAAILGHADASVTLRIYTDAPDLDKRREAMEMIDAEMSKQSLIAGK